MSLFVLKPLTFVLSSVDVSVHAESIHHVIAPVAVILITVGEDDLSLTVLLAIFPAALVAGSIRPGLHAVAVWEVSLWMPLAFVFGIAFDRSAGFIYSFH